MLCMPFLRLFFSTHTCVLSPQSGALHFNHAYRNFWNDNEGLPHQVLSAYKLVKQLALQNFLLNYPEDTKKTKMFNPPN